MLKLGQFMDIKELQSEGLSIRQIVERTGFSRNTVRKVLRGRHPMRAKVVSRSSKLDTFKDYVRQRVAEYSLSAVRLLPEIQAMGYDGSIQTLRRFVSGLLAPQRRLQQATVRFETPPGKQAQVDWTECGRFVIDGKPITVYAFVMVLSYSRKLYVQFTTSMKLPVLLHCHMEAFAYFGGWPEQILYDNMKQVRIGPGQLNEGLCDFATHYGFAVKTHRAYRPRTKGKVERSCHYVKDHFLTARSFDSLDDLNTQARHWLDHTANMRTHGTTGRVPNDDALLERLTPYADQRPYQLQQVVHRTVNSNSQVHYHGSSYSVPPSSIGQRVSVNSQGGQIWIKQGETVLAEHRAALRAGQQIIAKDHLAELWKITEQQVQVPPAPNGERWCLHRHYAVQSTPLSRFEEVLQ